MTTTQAEYIADALNLMKVADLCVTSRENSESLYTQALRILRAIPQACLPFSERRSINNLIGDCEGNLSLAAQLKAAELRPIPCTKSTTTRMAA